VEKFLILLMAYSGCCMASLVLFGLDAFSVPINNPCVIMLGPILGLTAGEPVSREYLLCSLLLIATFAIGVWLSRRNRALSIVIPAAVWLSSGCYFYALVARLMQPPY
jgi:hypothetical protein